MRRWLAVPSDRFSYTANLEKHGVSGIGMFGVAFSGKKVSVAYEEHDVKKRKSRE